jgi:hypothetical protein
LSEDPDEHEEEDGQPGLLAEYVDRFVIAVGRQPLVEHVEVTARLLAVGIGVGFITVALTVAAGAPAPALGSDRGSPRP